MASFADVGCSERTLELPFFAGQRQLDDGVNNIADAVVPEAFADIFKLLPVGRTTAAGLGWGYEFRISTGESDYWSLRKSFSAKWRAQQELNLPKSADSIDVSEATVPKTVPTPQLLPDLAEVSTAWRFLAEPFKAAILAIVRAVNGVTPKISPDAPPPVSGEPTNPAEKKVGAV